MSYLRSYDLQGHLEAAMALEAVMASEAIMASEAVMGYWRQYAHGNQGNQGC